MQTPAGSGGPNSVNTLNQSIVVQGAYRGSVASGTAAAQPLSLSLQDAIKRGIERNLGTVSAGNSARQSRAERLAEMAQLLPDIHGNVRETVQQINLAASGLKISAPIPGFRFPTIVGPFNYFDARASFAENLSITSLRNLQSSRQSASSADLSVRDARELVTLAVSGTYLQILAAQARIDTARAQIETAMAVYTQAVDRNRSGLNARIDVNRSQVELQTQQQRLSVLTDDFEKQKIALARLIGLPMAQTFALTDAVPYHPLPAPDLDAEIKSALTGRADVQAAAAQLKAAQSARAAATAEYYPSLNLSADYGAIGVTPTNQAHGTFSVTGGVSFPIFTSGRIRADVDQANAALAQRNAEYENAKGQAEQDVRNAVLDLNAAAQQVNVAESSRMLAADTVQQARDRFRAGVADTVELVQAQESQATAEQDYINAVFAFNLSQISLARAIGQTEQGVARLLQGK
jgi:outer membrane protein TolC